MMPEIAMWTLWTLMAICVFYFVRDERALRAARREQRARDRVLALHSKHEGEMMKKMKTKKIEMYRQGDVLLIRCDSEIGLHHARDVTPRDRIVLAYGEVTGHAHAIYPIDSAVPAVAVRDADVVDSDDRVEHAAADARVLPAKLWDAGAERYLQVISRTTLDHEEHASIALEPGVYRVVRQREYDPAVHQRYVED